MFPMYLSSGDEVSKRYLYHGSMYLRKQLASVTSTTVWPPESKDIANVYMLPMNLEEKKFFSKLVYCTQ